MATDEVGPVAKGAPAPTPPNPTPVPTPPGPPFSERVAGLVQAALGTTGVVVPAPSLPAGCSLYAASGAATLRYAKAPLKPIAVACDHAVEGALGQWKLTLTPKRKRAKKTPITLAAQPLPFASEGAVPVTLSLSAAQRKKVRSARSVKAVVTVAFPWLRGTFQKASKTFRLKT